MHVIIRIDVDFDLISCRKQSAIENRNISKLKKLEILESFIQQNISFIK